MAIKKKTGRSVGLPEMQGKYIHNSKKKKEGHEDARSDFGKGFFYNIFLFAKHFERYNDFRTGIKQDYSMWFYGAADHMLEMEVPPKMAKTKLGKDFAKIRDEIVSLRLPMGRRKEATREDFNRIFDKLEELLLTADKQLETKPVKANWN